MPGMAKLRLEEIRLVSLGSISGGGVPTQHAAHGTLATATRRPRLTTHFSQTTDMRSSTPLTPSGISVKLSLPTAFWAVVKVQCALPVTWRSPLRTSQGQSGPGMGPPELATAGSAPAS